jgi:hypothetical protein
VSARQRKKKRPKQSVLLHNFSRDVEVKKCGYKQNGATPPTDMDEKRKAASIETEVGPGSAFLVQYSERYIDLPGHKKFVVASINKTGSTITCTDGTRFRYMKQNLGNKQFPLPGRTRAFLKCRRKTTISTVTFSATEQELASHFDVETRLKERTCM